MVRMTMIPNFIVALIDSNQLMIQAISRGVESIQLMIQAGFHGIDSNQLATQANSTGIHSNQLVTLTAFPGNDSDSTHDSRDFQKYRFKSTRDSSEKLTILSRLMNQL